MKTGPNSFLKKTASNLDQFDGPSESFRAEAELSAKALLNNYDAIRAQVPEQSIMPMIKANAYGHGANWCARILAQEPGMYALGVATLEEGAEIRKALDSSKKRSKIVVVSGTTPFSEEKFQYCEKYQLTATLTREEDWNLLLREGYHKRIQYELKFNTGMNRLGMTPGFAKQVARTLKDRPGVEHPSGVLSHLAIGENTEEKLSRIQIAAFREIHRELSNAIPSTQFHIANSAGIWNAKAWGIEGLTDIVRPGLSLYGVPPWQGAPARGLTPVMTLRAPVIARHKLRPGDLVGYGGTFQYDAHSKKSPDEPGGEIAVLGIGYADGMKRSYSNRGRVFLNGVLESVIGIVSMDLCAVSCSPKTKVGDWAEIMGPSLDPWSQARSAETVPYELLTSVSARVIRRYI